MSKEIKKEQTNTLLNCPFCGGGNIISTYNNFVPALLCGGCGAMMTIPWSLQGNTEDELQKKWNTRKPMDRIVERLEEVAKTEIRVHSARCNGKTLAIGYAKGIENAIKIVKEEGGLNERI